ncbi:uncharacterized protein LOC141614910 [Silene latifolia]|uniref:uncharacterized protein LOC141614910 n=1 Tax=Silene latifolia TaxID=37657 RepID=UPI003D77F9ED
MMHLCLLGVMLMLKLLLPWTYSPTLRAARDVVKCTALLKPWRCCWSSLNCRLHGNTRRVLTVRCSLAGAVFGWTFENEVANHTLQLYYYSLDTMAAQTKFTE